MAQKKQRSSPARKRQRSSAGRSHSYIHARVREAAPIARRLVLQGIDPDHGTLFANIARFVGIKDLANMTGALGISEDAFPKVIEIGEDAYAIGIAVGLLMRSEAFNGGAR